MRTKSHRHRGARYIPRHFSLQRRYDVWRAAGGALGFNLAEASIFLFLLARLVALLFGVRVPDTSIHPLVRRSSICLAASIPRCLQGVVVYALFECWRKQKNKRGIYQVRFVCLTRVELLLFGTVVVALSACSARQPMPPPPIQSNRQSRTASHAFQGRCTVLCPYKSVESSACRFFVEPSREA